MDFDAIINRAEERKQKAIEFNSKREKYFAHYTERFNVRGYDRRNPFLFDKLTQFCAYYFAGVNKKGVFLCKPEIDIKGKSKEDIKAEDEHNTGVGKTWGVEIIGELFGIRVNTVSRFTDSFNDSRDKMYELLKEPNYYGTKKCRDAIIDEVGAEKIGNNFGVKSEVFIDVVDFRYSEFIQKGSFTHFTSNLTPKEIENRYGHRVWSRINEMATIIEVSGQDNRFE